MNSNLVITIGRSFGSGGREIGKALAAELDMKYYDKEILAEAANYDLCIDSSRLGTDGAVKLIMDYIDLCQRAR